MFDLPVDTKARARDATKFREFLLDQGFEKSQFSIDARFCNGKEQCETYIRRTRSARSILITRRRFCASGRQKIYLFSIG
jgi:CRISPR-associated endonuclease Cas2